MPYPSPQLRKAAILIRSLDGDSAAAVLSRLSPEEAKQVRLAIQSLGEVEDEERADVSAEFRRSGAAAQEQAKQAVELELSFDPSTVPTMTASVPSGRPFEFLENARVESLVPYLSREQPQTVAVVLSYLPPARAAEVLAALPEKLQAGTIERLSILGVTDPSTLQVLERELADWLARQQASRTRSKQRIDAVNSILAAAAPASRGQILTNLLKHNQELANQIASSIAPPQKPEPTMAEQLANLRSSLREATAPVVPLPPPAAIPRSEPEPPQLCFDDLTRFDAAGLAAILKSVDSEVLTLALVGASDEMIRCVTAQMPAKVAKAFRKRLNQFGPTRLRDVESAQQEVARAASQFFHTRRSNRSRVSA